MRLNPDVMMTDGGGEALPVKKKAVVMPPVQSPGPSDLNKLSQQFGNVKPVTASSDDVRWSKGYSSMGPNPKPAKGPGITKGQVAGGAADILFGASSFKSAVDNAKEVITGKDEKGKKVNRLKSAASVVGNTALGATNLVSTAALLVPGAGVGVKAGVVGLNTAVKGAKVANAVSPATSKAITTAVKAKNAAVEAAAAKSAKVVGAGDIVLDSAMKGAQFIGAQTKGKTASGIAAGVIALGPGAAGASAAGKTTTAITQSVNAAKKVTSAADTFVPKAAKSSTKVTSGGSVPNVIKPAVAAKGVKAGTSGKVAQTITAVDAGIKAAAGRTVTNNPFYNNNPFKTDNKDTTASTDAFNPSKNTDSDSKVTVDKSRVNQFESGISDQFKNTFSDSTKATKGEPTKVKPTKVTVTPEVTPEVIPEVIPEVTPEVIPGEDPPPPPPKKPPVKVIPPIKLSTDTEEINRKRKWTPSAIV